MTLNAIFRYPDLYKTGMAVAFVSDQRVYDTIYQERFMGLPQDNPEGYTNGSPITFAKNLKGNLLIVASLYAADDMPEHAHAGGRPMSGVPACV